MNEVLISVIIPAKNGDAWIEETIKAILNQTMSNRTEILIIDSGSSDGTFSIVHKYPVRLIQIQSSAFNHGLTRNLGAQEAKGKYVVMTVQDAKPASAFWLEQLLDGFSDDSVAGVCGSQIVPHHSDKNPAEWYRPLSKPVLKKIHFRDASDFEKLSGEEKLALCRWDDVNAMYRRDLFLKLPFRETDFAEDMLWARDALRAGFAIVYNPIAQVEHYHHYDYNFTFKRNFITRYHIYRYFGALPGRSRPFLEVLRNVKLFLREPGLSFIERWNWFWYNYRNQRAIDRSNNVFLKCLEMESEEKLTSLYQQICGVVPQAQKRASNVK